MELPTKGTEGHPGREHTLREEKFNRRLGYKTHYWQEFLNKASCSSLIRISQASFSRIYSWSLWISVATSEEKKRRSFKIVCHWGTKSTAFTLCGNVCDINGGSVAFSLWWFISKMATIDSFPFHMLLSYREMNLLLPSPGSWTIFLTVWVRYHLRITSQEHHSWEVQDAWRGPEAACGGAQEAMRHQILRWRITIGVSSPSCPTITPWG